MREFYPEIEPYKTHRLQVSKIHNIYVEECGNPNGYPILFLHGGPGAGLSTKHRRYFDPQHYRIILFDQRGSGKSTPHAELRENSTWHLVADIEVIRKTLGVSKWHVFGGSWGSTLALAYAETHPKFVSGLILRGIFLCTKEELDWFYQKGVDFIFPDYYEDYVKLVPKPQRKNLMKAYYKLLTHKNEKT